MLLNKTRLLITIITLLVVTSKVSAQDYMAQFSDKIDFNILNEIIKMSDDTVYVSNKNHLSEDSLFYFYDKNGNKAIEIGYEVAYPFTGKSAIVKNNGNWGLINRLGEFIYQSQFPVPIKLSSYEKYGIFDDGEIFDNGKVIYNLRSGTQQSGFINCAEPVTPDYFILKTKTGKYKLIYRKEEKSIFKTEMDSIISHNFLMYNNRPNLLILKKKDKYGLYLSDGNEILKIKHEKIQFLGKYIMLLENKVWKYYLFENNKLNLIISSEFQCTSPTYQSNAIGVYSKDKKYNILKINGKNLSQEFDYISVEGTFGIKNNSVMIFNSKADFHIFYKQ
ncbi:WG repeat-containing protein [Chryseobacterium turcicum]|uniref:WG repeat-containing protein n=1 Tax=Chryseobacterium turcicum TaxID=2898076 RepID=A0A9Q3V5E2_9FLAO|nr:WG repeat-containing protein [Chryseobacterium turcicum]MCD1118441.1 WG repeat-containing protein [Chryseobacterium turcicum]